MGAMQSTISLTLFKMIVSQVYVLIIMCLLKCFYYFEMQNVSYHPLHLLFQFYALAFSVVLLPDLTAMHVA